MISCNDLMVMLDELFINMNPSNQLRREWSNHRLCMGRYNPDTKEIVYSREDINELTKKVEFINSVLSINIVINLAKGKKPGPKQLTNYKINIDWENRIKHDFDRKQKVYDWCDTDYALKMCGSLILYDLTPNRMKWNCLDTV